MMKFEEEKLQLGKFIASGAFGAVYEGVYNGQKVAVKALELGDNRQEEEAMFLREASLWSKLDHPNVARFIGTAQLMLPDRRSHGRKRLHRCMVSEFLEGGALSTYLCQRKKKGLQLKTVIQLALDIARGLAYMHSEKFVHHDVKTDNVVLDGRGRVKLIDFGQSSEGDSYLSRKYDLLNFGICLREMLAGRILGGCTKELKDLIIQCGGGDGEFRPDMAQVVEILEDMSAELEEAKPEPEKRKKAFKGCFGFFTRSPKPTRNRMSLQQDDISKETELKQREQQQEKASETPPTT